MKPCERTIIHRVPIDQAGRGFSGVAQVVLWCKTHEQEMLTGLLAQSAGTKRLRPCAPRLRK